MKSVRELIKERAPFFSFELFPPKTEEGYQKLLSTITQLCALKPNFFSCTYGAGGGSREKTLDIVEHIQKQCHVPAVAHLTCVMHTKDEIKNILRQMKSRGISQVLALRGDPPKDNPNWQPGPENFQYSSDLVAFIRKEFGDYFTIGVAGFPEGHLMSPDRETDAKFLKLKVDSGADFIITQLFFNNEDYFEYAERLKRLGVKAPVIPGVLPITDYNGLLRFCGLCGASIPQKIHDIFGGIANDPAKVLEAGTAFAIEQCKDLLKGGAPGIHFYTLNKVSPTDQILKTIRS